MFNKKYKAIVAIDFDATIVDSKFPKIIGLRPNSKKVINSLYDNDFFIIINTCRNEEELTSAIEFLKENGVKYHLANENHQGLINHFGGDCRKISFDISIDDKNLDCLENKENLEWNAIYKKIHKVVSQSNFKSILDLI